MRSFTYERAKTAADAAKTVAETQGAKFIAGGTGYRTTRRRLDFYLSLQATIVKSCTGMVMRYTARPTAPST